MTLPFSAAFIVGAMLAPAIVKRVSPADVMAGGLAIATVGFVMLTQVGVDSDVALLVTSSVVFAFGLAPLFTLTNDLIIGSAPPERAGAASGISETDAELGGALAIAILGTLGTAVYRNRLDDEIPEGVPDASAVADQLPPRLGDELLEAGQAAFTVGLQVGALVSAIIAAGTAVLAAILLRGLTMGSETEHAGTLGAVETAVPEAPRD